MKTTTLTYTQDVSKKKETTSREAIIDFYNEATEDYSFWSKDLNMHFGYFIFGKTNPLKRDSMGNEMNNQIYNRLNLSKNTKNIADLGCGMGGTMRYMLKKQNNLSMVGVTLSPFQVEEGNKLLKNKKGLILQENYCNTSFSNNSMEGAIAIESYCHSGHSEEALKEAFRILKPEANLVIADAFLKKDAENLCKISNYSYRNLCKGWSLDGLGVIEEVKNNLKKIGFKKVRVEDVSFRVAPSVFHVPFAIGGFILKNILLKNPLKLQSWNNMKASFYALISGLHMKDFGYYIITATK